MLPYIPKEIVEAITLCAILVIFFVLLILYAGSIEKSRKRREAERRQFIEELQAGSQELTSDEFLELRDERLPTQGRPLANSDMDCTGVYVIENKTRGIHYVGQGTRVFDRINSHFKGHGNPGVFKDLVLGDDFTVRIFGLTDSGYSNLDDMERNYISLYRSNELGYNRTRGNS